MDELLELSPLLELAPPSSDRGINNGYTCRNNRHRPQTTDTVPRQRVVEVLGDPIVVVQTLPDADKALASVIRQLRDVATERHATAVVGVGFSHQTNHNTGVTHHSFTAYGTAVVCVAADAFV